MKGPRALVLPLAERAGIADLRRQSRSTESVAVAVDENARLARLLEQQVAEIERSLVPLLEADEAVRRR